MLRSIGLTHTHMECRYLKETIPVMTDLLAFEKIAEQPGEVTLKHSNTDWTLIVHEAGPDAPTKQMHNHWGVRVMKTEEVDAAYEYLTAHKEEYHLGQIGKPTYNHGSYSVYFLEPGTNGWEIECYEGALRKDVWLTRVGGVRAPHWEKPMSSDRFPGKGYVPQGFTHGTLASSDLKKFLGILRKGARPERPSGERPRGLHQASENQVLRRLRRAPGVAELLAQFSLHRHARVAGCGR
jgi:hypothetical protein